jgi:hypothetical protein
MRILSQLWDTYTWYSQEVRQIFAQWAHLSSLWGGGGVSAHHLRSSSAWLSQIAVPLLEALPQTFSLTSSSAAVIASFSSADWNLRPFKKTGSNRKWKEGACGSTILLILVGYFFTKETCDLVHCHDGAASFQMPKREAVYGG